MLACRHSGAEWKAELDGAMQSFLAQQTKEVTDLTTRLVDGLVRLEVLFEQKCAAQNKRLTALSTRVEAAVQQQGAVLTQLQTSLTELRAQSKKDETRLNGRVSRLEKALRGS
jgi:hypothetical protein